MAIYTRFGSEVKVLRIIKTGEEGPVDLEYYRVEDGPDSEVLKSDIGNFKANGGIGEILSSDAPIVIQ